LLFFGLDFGLDLGFEGAGTFFLTTFPVLPINEKERIYRLTNRKIEGFVDVILNIGMNERCRTEEPREKV
jgi:hypothetical protein